MSAREGAQGEFSENLFDVISRNGIDIKSGPFERQSLGSGQSLHGLQGLPSSSMDSPARRRIERDTDIHPTIRQGVSDLVELPVDMADLP